MKKIIFYMILGVLLLAGCSSEEYSIIGTWQFDQSEVPEPIAPEEIFDQFYIFNEDDTGEFRLYHQDYDAHVSTFNWEIEGNRILTTREVVVVTPEGYNDEVVESFGELAFILEGDRLTFVNHPSGRGSDIIFNRVND